VVTAARRKRSVQASREMRAASPAVLSFRGRGGPSPGGKPNGTLGEGAAWSARFQDFRSMQCHTFR
jgi:hypothetical protein